MTQPADSTPPPLLRVVLGVGEPERERRLIEGLGAGGVTIAGRCLDTATLVDRAHGHGDADVALASSDLHRLTPATLLAIREAGLPLVLLADTESLTRYRELAYLVPLDSAVADIRAALTQAAGRGPMSDQRTATSRHGTTPAVGAEERSPGRVIALTGGKGAPGVTTVAVALASALADRGRSVLLIDADLRLGGMNAHLDLDPRRGLFTLAYGPRAGRDDWARRLGEESQDGPGFAVLAGIERPELRAQIGTDVMVAVLGAARGRFQDVVVDAGAAIRGLTPSGSEAALRRAEQVLLVALPDLPGIWNARAALHALRDGLGIPADRLAIVLNRRAGRDHYAAEEVVRALAAPVLGVVPDDRRAVRRALAGQFPMTHARGRGAAAAVRELAATLLGAETDAAIRRRSWRLAWRRA